MLSSGSASTEKRRRRGHCGASGVALPARFLALDRGKLPHNQTRPVARQFKTAASRHGAAAAGNKRVHTPGCSGSMTSSQDNLCAQTHATILGIWCSGAQRDAHGPLDRMECQRPPGRVPPPPPGRVPSPRPPGRAERVGRYSLPLRAGRYSLRSRIGHLLRTRVLPQDGRHVPNIRRRALKGGRDRRGQHAVPCYDVDR
jgi:hypothetical protein